MSDDFRGAEKKMPEFYKCEHAVHGEHGACSACAKFRILIAVCFLSSITLRLLGLLALNTRLL